MVLKHTKVFQNKNLNCSLSKTKGLIYLTNQKLKKLFRTGNILITVE